MKKPIWIFILLAFCIEMPGQNQDARLWASFSLRYNMGRKWRITLEEEARFRENITRPDKLNSELTIDYQINKTFETGLLYRFILRNTEEARWELYHRFSAFIGAQKQYSGWTFSMRSTFQKTYPSFMHEKDWYVPENYVRTVGEISREIKSRRIEPYTSLEFWYRLPAGDQAFVDQYRYTAGIKHKLNKNHRVEVYYRLQQELQVKDPLTAHIIGIGYRFYLR